MAEHQFNSNYEYQDHLLAHQEAGTLKDRIKPVVHLRYTGLPATVGQRASVKTYDHPDMSLNYAPWVNTSVVVSVEDNGNFESYYTRYVLVGNDELTFE